MAVESNFAVVDSYCYQGAAVDKSALELK